MDIMELVAAVKKHALDNYNSDGWDMIVECMSDADIIEILNNPLDGPKPVIPEQAIAAVREVAKLWDDRRRDIQATAW